MTSEISHPDAIMLRSHKLIPEDIAETVQATGGVIKVRIL